MLLTPALAFVLGVLAAALVAVVAGLLWWADRRRLLQGVVAFSLGGLERSLDEMLAELPPDDAQAARLRGCRALCASLPRLLQE